MTKLRVHALCEHGLTREPYCSGHIRILRPLGHPTVSARVELTASRHYTPARPARHDVVVVERLWTPHIRLSVARDLVKRVRESGTRLVFAVDDNMFDLAQTGVFAAWLGDEAVPVLELFAREADGILTTTEPLRERMLRYNDRIAVVPNSLDERLMCARARRSATARRRPARHRLHGDQEPRRRSRDDRAGAAASVSPLGRCDHVPGRRRHCRHQHAAAALGLADSRW